MLLPSGRVVLAVVALAALVPPPAAAQTVSGGVSGSVVDQTRQVIQGATVTLVNEQTGDTRVTTSNETGVFVFSAVRPGTYTVRIELSGFTTVERRNTVVPANESVPIGTVQLDVGGLSEAITLTSPMLTK